MLVFGLKSHSSKTGDRYVTFSVAVPLAGGHVTLPGWIYFPTTKRLYKPSRVNARGRRVSLFPVTDDALKAVKREIEAVVKLAAEDWPAERIRDAVVALAELPPEEIAKITALVAGRQAVAREEEGV